MKLKIGLNETEIFSLQVIRQIVKEEFENLEKELPKQFEEWNSNQYEEYDMMFECTQIYNYISRNNEKNKNGKPVKLTKKHCGACESRLQTSRKQGQCIGVRYLPRFSYKSYAGIAI